MNIVTLIELKEYHSVKAEELLNLCRDRQNHGDREAELSFGERAALRMHERFVAELDQVLSKPC